MLLVSDQRGLVLSRRIFIRLVEQQLIDFRHDFWRQLGQQLQTLDVVDDLLRSRSTGNNRRDVFVLQTPRQSELGELEAEFIGEGLSTVNYLS